MTGCSRRCWIARKGGTQNWQRACNVLACGCSRTEILFGNQGDPAALTQQRTGSRKVALSARAVRGFAGGNL